MTLEEKDRLFEILFYLYFNNIPETKSGTTEFWNAIRSICFLFKVNDMDIVKAIRILMVKENIPTDEETYYLLHKLGLSVRPLRTISGIYWQKQKMFDTKFISKPPVITRRITDVVTKNSIKNFIIALYETLGIFSYISKDLLENIL